MNRGRASSIQSRIRARNLHTNFLRESLKEVFSFKEWKHCLQKIISIIYNKFDAISKDICGHIFYFTHLIQN